MNNDVWPVFLELLKSNPRRAAEEFAVFAVHQLKFCPPTIMRSLSESERDDIIQEVILHCTDKKLKLLRSYRNTGRPFAVWLYFITRNKAIDHLRRKGLEIRYVRSTNSPGNAHEVDWLGGPEQKTAVRDVLVKVAKELSGLDQKCRILLRFAADEYPPREIALALGLTPEHAKKISDDLRHCRRKLRDCVESKGINISDYL